MDILEDKTDGLLRLAKGGVSLELFEGRVRDQLYVLNSDSEKNRYLVMLKNKVQSAADQHATVCSSPETCPQSKGYATALYSINGNLATYLPKNSVVDQNDTNLNRKIFAKGQIFDAFVALRNEVRKAIATIVLIDNYIDEQTLAYFDQKSPLIKLRILTKAGTFSPGFQRAVNLYNEQYSNLEVKGCADYHDRFLVIDDSLFYHIGASVKDAGKKVFMYTEIQEETTKNVVRNLLNSQWPDIYI